MIHHKNAPHLFEAEVDVETHILLLVALSEGDLAAPRLEVPPLQHSEPVVLHCEGRGVQDAGDVVVAAMREKKNQYFFLQKNQNRKILFP